MSGFTDMSMVIVLEILLKLPSEDTPYEVEGERYLSLPLTEASILSGNSSLESVGRRDDRW